MKDSVSNEQWLGFNVNDYVRVKLTPVGREILRKRHEELDRFADGALGEYSPPKEDADGWVKIQMWRLMADLGAACRMGLDQPFETNIQIEAGKLK